MGLELFLICGFGGYFCFNSKPSFSFESWRQRITFPVASEFRCKHYRVGLESKPPPSACFDLQFCHSPHGNHNHNLCTLTTKLLLVSSFQNCELKQEPAHLQPSYKWFPACFDSQFCHSPHRNHNPQFIHTYNQIITGLLISKLWVKTRSKHTYNRAISFPQC